ncbi:MAG: hypothetical protein ACJAZO_002368 [Myxococcota bacterium]|jgi:hypothetical protein
MRAALVPLCLLVLAGCPQDIPISALVPEIVITPGELVFGEQAVPVPVAQDLVISNGGRADLDVELSFDGDGAFVFDPLTLTIPPGEAQVVIATFIPDTFLEFTGTLTVASNDVETPTVIVPVSGIGVDLPVPDIDFSSRVLDFGTVETGSLVSDFFLLRNAGEATLSLEAVDQGGSGAFSLITDPSNTDIAGGGEVPVLIQYAPTYADGDGGTLLFTSNDPDEATVEVALLGNGGGDFDWPEAVINCPGSAEPPENISLNGDGSNDPGGNLPLRYEWSLTERPPGSRAELQNLVSADTRFFADIAGTFEVQLIVENSQGVRSAPDRCEIAAIPTDELHVELTWDTSRADLDLHLMQENGTLFDNSTDATWCNPRPNWGGAGAADNPSLDIDDRGGFGPENINIEAPADGEYTVAVHYFEEHGDDAVTATVRIYSYGELELTRSRILSRNEVWNVAQVNWPDGTVGVLSQEPEAATARSCN